MSGEIVTPCSRDTDQSLIFQNRFLTIDLQTPFQRTDEFSIIESKSEVNLNKVPLRTLNFSQGCDRAAAFFAQR